MGVFLSESAFTRLDDPRPTQMPFAGPEATVEAEDELLQDVALFAEWLNGECAGKPPVRLGYVPTNPAYIDDMVAAAQVPTLVALLLYPSRAAAGAAALGLGAHFVQAKQSRVLAIAARIEQEREKQAEKEAADEQEERDWRDRQDFVAEQYHAFGGPRS